MKMKNMAKMISRMDRNSYSNLAYRWAPIHYQYANKTNVRRDMLCSVNFDGDWDTSNNRKHLYDYSSSLIPVVYYATAETGTHYYIMYCFYHADDMTHENDLEGCLLVIEKEERLQAMVTIAHFDFFSYAVRNGLNGGVETLDGELYVEEFNGVDHPMTMQEQNNGGVRGVLIQSKGLE
jgi:hypothetical protein